MDNYRKREKNHVSVRRLIAEGRKIMKSLKIEGLKFSWGWVSKFLKRNRFTLKKPSAKIGKQMASLKDEFYKFKEKLKTYLRQGTMTLTSSVMSMRQGSQQKPQGQKQLPLLKIKKKKRVPM